MGIELVNASGDLDTITVIALTVSLVTIFICFRIQARNEEKERKKMDYADTDEIKRNIVE